MYNGIKWRRPPMEDDWKITSKYENMNIFSSLDWIWNKKTLSLLAFSQAQANCLSLGEINSSQLVLYEFRWPTCIPSPWILLFIIPIPSSRDSFAPLNTNIILSWLSPRWCLIHILDILVLFSNIGISTKLTKLQKVNKV